MTTIFVVSFAVGLLSALVLAAAGDLHLGGGGHHVHVSGHHTHAHAPGHHGHSSGSHGRMGPAQNILGFVLSWISPVTLAGAALLFGGAGLLMGGSVYAIPVAVVAAIIGAVALRLLLRAFVQSSTTPLSLTGEGAIATVNAAILPGSTGEVVYTLEGLHRSVAARSNDNVSIPRGTQVVITRQDRGIAWVQPLDPLDSSFPS